MVVSIVSSCSQRRIAANRANARKTTGPRTAAGKAAVARNATKHGLRSERVVETSPTRRRAFDESSEALRRELKPVGLMQSIVFDRIAALAWKMKSLPSIERQMLRADRAERLSRQAERERRMGEAAEPLKRAELSASALIARWFRGVRGDGGNCFATLRRYEAGIERSFYRACAELKRLQKDDAEKGQASESPSDRLAVNSPRQAQVVMLRFFAGRSEAEIAEMLRVSEKTIRRDWQTARLWLYTHLADGASGRDSSEA